MSVEAIVWALHHSKAKGNVRCVLIAIANHAGSYGENAYPSIETLMALSNIDSKNTVIAAIRKLEELGELLVYPDAGEGWTGGRRSHRYELPLVPGWKPPRGIVPRTNFGSSVEPKSDENFGSPSRELRRDRDEPSVQFQGTFGSDGCTTPVPLHPSLSTRPSHTPTLALVPDAVLTHGGASESAPTFDDFWAVYPRKRAKGDARKAWVTEVVKAKVDPALVVEGARRYAEECKRDRRENAYRFIAYPATWLRAAQWEDEPDAPTGASKHDRFKRMAQEMGL